MLTPDVFSRARRLATAWLTGVCLAGACSLASAQATTGQPVDTEAPLIEFEALAESRAEASQVFTALVVDNEMLQDVVLYYRRSGQRPFTARRMEPIGNSGYYSVSVPTDPSDLRAIEYYLQARDAHGNRTVNGFAFDPHVRSLLPALAAVPSAPTSSTAPAASTRSAPAGQPVEAADRRPLFGENPRRRWLMVGLGVLAVGALASLSGGSSGGADPDDGKVPFSIDLATPR